MGLVKVVQQYTLNQISSISASDCSAVCLLCCTHWQITACAPMTDYGSLIAIISRNTAINAASKSVGKRHAGLIDGVLNKAMLINHLIVEH